MGAQSPFKKVLRPVRLDQESVEEMPAVIEQLGLRETVSDFIRNSVRERLQRLSGRLGEKPGETAARGFLEPVDESRA